MRGLLFLLMAGILLFGSGCARHVTWGHATKTETDYNSDENNCRYEAEKATAYYAPNFPAQVEQAQRKTQIYMMCMKNRGYYVME